MTLSVRSWKNIVASAFAVSIAFTATGCTTSETPEDTATSQEDAAVEAVEIAIDTAAGEESQRIVELLNAEEDTSAADWEGHLHPSFTDEVPVEDLVDLFNQNLRPAQPFTVTDYEGGDRQAVTTLASPVSEPIDMTVTLDTDSLITGLFFGESTAG